MVKNRFEGCFQKYQNLIMFVVWERTSDYELAQDIRQQVFFEFLVHMDQVSPGREKAWLMRCTRNAVVDHIRVKARWGELPADHEYGADKSADLLEDRSLERLELQLSIQPVNDQILSELKRANVHWYEAMKLCFVEGFTYMEAAERLNVSEEVVRSWISRARAYIKEKFWNEYMKWMQ